MRDENKYRKYRLSRGRDGSIEGAKKVTEDDLAESWNKQNKSLSKDPSLKEEFGLDKGVKKLKSSLKNKKPKDIKYKKAEDSKGNVNIMLSMPKLSIPKNPIKRIGKRPAIISLIVVFFVSSGVILFSINTNNTEDPSATEVKGESQESIQLNVDPEYAVLSPGGAGAEFAEISPPGGNPVYAYTDDINGVPVKVSQQKLPDNLKDDQSNRVRQLAGQFNATEEIFIDEYIAYVGKSLDGPQSVVYVRGELMILVVADSEVPNKDWVEYLGSLKY